MNRPINPRERRTLSPSTECGRVVAIRLPAVQTRRPPHGESYANSIEYSPADKTTSTKPSPGSSHSTGNCLGTRTRTPLCDAILTMTSSVSTSSGRRSWNAKWSVTEFGDTTDCAATEGDSPAVASASVEAIIRKRGASIARSAISIGAVIHESTVRECAR